MMAGWRSIRFGVAQPVACVMIAFTAEQALKPGAFESTT